ncbi:MAG: hypothetical protein AAFY02_13865, partial [Pseudomonadota bacterium]
LSYLYNKGAEFRAAQEREIDPQYRALGESTASQLPGRGGGLADVYRHVLLAAEAMRVLGRPLTTRELVKHELDVTDGLDNGLDSWNNAQGMKIGLYAREYGNSWQDVVRLSREAMTQTFAGSDIGEIERTWRREPAETGLSKFYHDAPVALPGRDPGFDVWKNQFVLDQDFYVKPGTIELDGGRLKLEPLGVAPPRQWTKNPMIVDEKGIIQRDPQGEPLRKTVEQSAWPDAEGNWNQGKGFVYEEGNAAPPLLGDLTKRTREPRNLFHSWHLPTEGKGSYWEVQEERARRFYDNTYRR